MKRFYSILLSLVLSFGILAPWFGIEARAEAVWPGDVLVESEGAILMDADSGAVLYGKNIHTQYFPASITKILTALIIVEECDLNEQITFSHNAVYNVEAGSSNAGLDEGDTISVRDALYALLLKSANEAANALAEHCSGSIENFAKKMNERAREIGCTESHFMNPSGLNDPEHYVTAYDYALISREAFLNPIFMEIDSTTYYDLPPTKNFPEGQTIYTHHAMLKRSNALHYPGIIGGKTGYTTLAGNTLVTGAQRDGLDLIVVILNGHLTHYTDTKALLDFGFNNFKNILISDVDHSFTDVMNNVDLVRESLSSGMIQVDNTRCITLPKNADFSSANRLINYDLEKTDPPNAIARLEYTFGERNIGHTYLLSTYGQNEPEASLVLAENSTEGESMQESKSLESEATKNAGDVVSGTLPAESSLEQTEAVQAPAVADRNTENVWIKNLKSFIKTFPHLFYTICAILGIFALLMILKTAIILYDKHEIRKNRRKREERKKAQLGGKSTTDILDLDLASEDGKSRNRKWI